MNMYLTRQMRVLHSFSAFKSFKHSGFHTSHFLRESIKPCDNIPYVDLFENDPKTIVNIRDLCGGKKVVLFGVPGAFTTLCSKVHLPGYIARADALKKMGVEEIICISVNDPFIMSAWGKHHNAQGKVRMLADTSGCFTRAIGLGMDIPGLGGFRSKRYSMVVQNAIVLNINVEPDGTSLTVSAADRLKV